MNAAPDINEIVIMATLWLMHRYRQTGCPRLACMVEQHLAWLRKRADTPGLADAFQRLSLEWRLLKSDADGQVAKPLMN
jgi:hypothetical protein